MSKSISITPAQFTTFGELLRFLRHRAGLSQLELSIAVNYSGGQISRMEKNERAPDSAVIAARFVPALDLEREPEWIARLLELAAASRAESNPVQRENTVPRAPNNLPLQLTSFIGRETEIAQVKSYLSDARLVTLTGVGGVGKTRLALQAGRESVNAYVDGVWVVELAPLADATLIPQRVALVLELREEISRPISETLIRYLKPKHLLLVMDNCEHLIAACAQLSEALLLACPNVHILATSREPLGIPGERSYRVPSLELPDPLLIARGKDAPTKVSQYDAVRLFVERARDVTSDFKLTSENAHTVAQVARQLDGIPLAIELAVARLKMMSVEQIAARLDDRFLFLTGGSRTALPRHQTLEAMIDWSYDLLSEPERVLLQRLSVFAGGWTLEAAEAVCSDALLAKSRAVHLLGNLVDKSLVLVEEDRGATRYRMLETIRQYALEKLKASGEAEIVRRLAAEYYLAWAQRGNPGTEGNPQFEWLARMRAEHDNLRAALTWSQSARGGAELGLKLAAAMASLWEGQDPWSEGRARLEGALAHADADGIELTEERAVACQILGTLLMHEGDYAAAQAQLTESLLLFQKVGNLKMSAGLLANMGVLAREQGDATKARACFEEVLALQREWGEKTFLAWNLVSYGEVAVMVEDTVWATSLIEESLTLFRELADFDHVKGQAWAYNHLGHVAQLRGEYEQATRLHEESLSLFQTDDRESSGAAWGYQGLGESALGQSNAELAKKYLIKALTVFRELGDRKGMAWCLAGFAGVAALEEEPERAVWLWGAADGLRRSFGARHAPASRVTRERLMAMVRDELGDEAFMAAWTQGETADIDKIVEDMLASAS